MQRVLAVAMLLAVPAEAATPPVTTVIEQITVDRQDDCGVAQIQATRKNNKSVDIRFWAQDGCIPFVADPIDLYNLPASVLKGSLASGRFTLAVAHPQLNANLTVVGDKVTLENVEEEGDAKTAALPKKFWRIVRRQRSARVSGTSSIGTFRRGTLGSENRREWFSTP